MKLNTGVKWVQRTLLNRHKTGVLIMTREGTVMRMARQTQVEQVVQQAYVVNATERPALKLVSVETSTPLRVWPNAHLKAA